MEARRSTSAIQTAVLGQVVLDPRGRIFSCFEGAGNADAQVGTYNPEYRLDSTRVARWTQLNALESPFCAECRFAFVCAGGCPWHIVHRGKTECMPIAQQVGLAWNFFADEFMARLGIPDSSAQMH
jgi:radical SAM protein with 4Fe4S-binding SPASM domain